MEKRSLHLKPAAMAFVILLALSSCATGASSSGSSPAAAEQPAVTATAAAEQPAAGTPAPPPEASEPAEASEPEPAAETQPALSLSVEIFDRGNAPQGFTAVDNGLTKWIVEHAKEDINVDVTFVPVPRSEETTKLNILMASNTAPDVVINYSMAVVANYAKNGGLTDLGSYIDQFGPEIKTTMGDTMKYGFIHGKQHALPAVRPYAGTKYITYIRKDWLDALGLEVPKTKAEFYNALVQFKEKDPGGIGAELIPYGMGANETSMDKHFENILLSYAEYPTERDFYVYDGYLRNLAPGTKEGFREMNKWYNEGLINKDFPLDTSDKALVENIVNGKVGAFTDMAKAPIDTGTLDTLYENVPGAEFIGIETFENAEGVYWVNQNDPIGAFLMVPKANEANAEAAIKYLDWMARFENYNAIIYAGEEGVGYELDAEGVPQALKSSDQLAAEGVVSSMPGDTAITFIRGYPWKTLDLFAKASLTSKFPQHTELFKSLVPIMYAPQAYFTPYFTVPIAADEQYAANLQKIIRTTFPAKVITAAPADFDAVYDEEHKRAMEAGATAVYEERGKAYDEGSFVK